MKTAHVFVNEILAGELIEHNRYQYEFTYTDHYEGDAVSLTMPVKKKKYSFTSFPAFFEGLLPEGEQLKALLRDKKINRDDFFSQLLVCGADCVGSVSVKEKMKVKP